MRLQHGFTILELIVVIAILAVFAAVLSPFVYQSKKETLAAEIISTANTLQKVVERYYIDNGKYPLDDPLSADPNMRNLSIQPTGLTTWKGPYLDTPLLTSGNSQRIVIDSLEDSNYFPGNFGTSTITKGSTLIIYNTPIEIAQLVNNYIDIEESTNWAHSGLVKFWAQNEGIYIIGSGGNPQLIGNVPYDTIGIALSRLQ